MLITCTCCYDLTKGTQDKGFSYSFSILSTQDKDFSYSFSIISSCLSPWQFNRVGWRVKPSLMHVCAPVLLSHSVVQSELPLSYWYSHWLHTYSLPRIDILTDCAHIASLILTACAHILSLVLIISLIAHILSLSNRHSNWLCTHCLSRTDILTDCTHIISFCLISWSTFNN